MHARPVSVTAPLSRDAARAGPVKNTDPLPAHTLRRTCRLQVSACAPPRCLHKQASQPPRGARVLYIPRPQLVPVPRKLSHSTGRHSTASFRVRENIHSSSKVFEFAQLVSQKVASHAVHRRERGGAAADGQLQRARPPPRRKRVRGSASSVAARATTPSFPRVGVRAPDDRRRVPDGRRGGSHSRRAGVVRGGHRACGGGVGVLPGAQPRRAAGAPAGDAAGAGAPLPPAVRGQGRPAQRLLPLGHAHRHLAAAAVLVRGLPRPARRRLRGRLQLRRPHRPQGCDAGGGGRHVQAGEHAGHRASGGGAWARPGGRELPGRLRRDDVLPPAEPVPAVPLLPGHVRPGAAHGQRLPHRALPGPRRRPAAHEGRRLGGRQAHPRRAHRQHWRPLPGMEQQQVQERRAQSDDERDDGEVLCCLLPLPVLRLANRHLQGAFALHAIHVRRLQEKSPGGCQKNREEGWAPQFSRVETGTHAYNWFLIHVPFCVRTSIV